MSTRSIINAVDIDIVGYKHGVMMETFDYTNSLALLRMIGRQARYLAGMGSNLINGTIFTVGRDFYIWPLPLMTR